MTNKTNWPDDAREEAQKALSTAQDTAVRTGEKYLRENPIPIILGALLIGAVLGALLRPPLAKNPMPHRLCVTGWKRPWKNLLRNGPRRKHKHAPFRMIFSTRLRIFARR